MPLSVQSLVTSFRLARQLETVDALLSDSAARIASSKRINSAKDDPSGMVSVSKLRGQSAAFTQAVTNSQTASNLLDVLTDSASGSLAAIDDEIDDIITAIGAADQSAVDAALDNINQIAGDAAFGTRFLANGASEARASQTAGAATLRDIQVFQTNFVGASATVRGTVSFVGELARLVHGNVNGDVTLEITGPFGSLTTTLTAGQNQTNLQTFINANRATLGLTSPAAGTITSLTYGSDQTISIRQVSNAGGGFTGVGGTAGQFPTGDGQTVSDAGSDSQGTVEGAAFRSTGRQINFSSGMLRGQFNLDAGGAEGAVVQTFTLNVIKGPLNLQLGPTATTRDQLQVSVPNLGASYLGMLNHANFAGVLGVNVGGNLSTLRSGQANDLVTNSANALRIANGAKSMLGRISGFLGAKQNQADNLLAVNQAQVSNLDQGISDIEDLNIAQETANFTRLTLQYQSTTAVLAQLNSFNTSIVAQLLNFPSVSALSISG